jgi:hypothetical protein
MVDRVYLILVSFLFGCDVILVLGMLNLFVLLTSFYSFGCVYFETAVYWGHHEAEWGVSCSNFCIPT